MIEDLVFRYDRLDAWMEARGLSSAEVADATTLSYNYIYMLRIGRRPNVSAVNLMRIALAVGCTAEYLLGVSDDPMGRGSQGGDEEIRLLLAFRALPLYRQRDVVTIAQALAGQGAEAEQQMSNVLDLVRSLFGEMGVEAITGALAGLASTIPVSDPARLITQKEEGEILFEEGDVVITEADVARAIRVGGERMGADYQSLMDNEPIGDDKKKKRARKTGADASGSD